MDPSKPDIFKPIKPYIITQPWGVYDPADYSQFGFTRHNGIDMALAPDAKIYAPFDGQIIRVATQENGQWQPNGGGVFVSLLTDPLAFPAFTNTTPDGKVVEFAAGTYRILFDALHCESISVTLGQQVKAGDLLAIEQDHPLPAPAGAETYRILNGEVWLADVDTNEANNSFDPTQFFNGFYALDAVKAHSLLEQVAGLLETEVAALKARLTSTAS